MDQPIDDPETHFVELIHESLLSLIPNDVEDIVTLLQRDANIPKGMADCVHAIRGSLVDPLRLGIIALCEDIEQQLPDNEHAAITFLRVFKETISTDPSRFITTWVRLWHHQHPRHHQKPERMKKDPERYAKEFVRMLEDTLEELTADTHGIVVDDEDDLDPTNPELYHFSRDDDEEVTPTGIIKDEDDAGPPPML